MNIELRRLEIDEDATIGELRINGEWFSWTLEDRVRAQKIKHATAIPVGQYQIAITQSQRFGQPMPEILNVPEFSGIRIHPGNTAADTSGCILVGLTRNGARIGESRRAFEMLMKRFEELGESGPFLTITQPDAWPRWNERVILGGSVSQPFPSNQSSGQRVSEEIYSIQEKKSQPVSTPMDSPIQATVDSDRAWRTNLTSWVLSIGSGGWAYLQNNYRLLLLVASFCGFITLCWFIRSTVLDWERMKHAADPGKYNVQ